MPRWAWIVIGVLIAGVFALLALGAAGVYFFTQQVEIREATTASAASLFDESRARFKGMQPLIELDSDGGIVRSRIADPPKPGARAAAVKDLHILAWDDDEGKMVQIAVPFWLLRLKRGPIDVFTDAHGLRNADLRITVDQLEALGPVLLIDHRPPRGDRVLVWTQ